MKMTSRQMNLLRLHQMNLLTLPDNLYEVIASFLDIKDHSQFEQTSKKISTGFNDKNGYFAWDKMITISIIFNNKFTEYLE